MFHLFTAVFASMLLNLVAQSVHAGCVAPVLLQMQASQLGWQHCDGAAASSMEFLAWQVRGVELWHLRVFVRMLLQIPGSRVSRTTCKPTRLLVLCTNVFL